MVAYDVSIKSDSILNNPIICETSLDIANEILRKKIFLNSMVKEIVFGNILRVNGTLNDHLSTHGSSVYNLDQIHKILLGLEAANELGVVWRSERRK